VYVTILGAAVESGKPFSVQVGRTNPGDVVLSLTVAGVSCNFSVNGGTVASQQTVKVPGGGNPIYEIGGWGTGKSGDPVVIRGTTTDEGVDQDKELVA
jgi:hypothetical protein